MIPVHAALPSDSPRPTAPSIRAARVPAWAYLLAGSAATVLVGMRWNVAPLAWVTPVPFMLYLRATRGWRSRLLLLVALQVATNLQVLKMITEPLSPAVALAFAIPFALGSWVAYVAWDALRSGAGEAWALYGFPALAALLEVVGYRLSEGGVWGAAAITQVGNLPLLQLASVGGVSAIGFLIAWVASLVALLLAAPEPWRWRHHVAALSVTIIAVFTWGAVRTFAVQDGPTLRVAGVVADLGLGGGGLPGADEVTRNTEELFARSEIAAGRDARVVVWNEGATIVEKDGEAAFIERGARLARERGVDLVLAYIVPITRSPFTFENKYVWLSEDGAIVETYRKHHPVPGEGSSPGTDPLRALGRPWGRAAGAICYDYDFPAMALEHARLGAGVVFVPSSDWRGIDPYHSEMARIRAIEGGFSIVRPVRWATSMAFDAYGRQRASLPFFEQNDRVLLATIPVEPVRTLYAQIGDAPAALYAVYLLAAVVVAFRRRGRAPQTGRSRAR